MSKQNKLMVIDGNSIVSRAFYGMPLLTNANGAYTNAVLGFMNIFLKLYEEEKPDLVAVAFDLPVPTFRHMKYEAYKGTRKPMPEELRPQLPMLKHLLNSMQIPIVQLEGYEADDVLGTMAVMGERQNLQVVLVSGDRDLLQMATETTQVRIPKTKSGKTEIENYFAKDVKEKTGLTPKEFIEAKALQGDASDNIPGVPGIGEKTAVKIIQAYGTVENAILHAAEIVPKKAGQNLQDFQEQARLSKELATIFLETPIPNPMDSFVVGNMWNEQAFVACQELGFKSLLSRFEPSLFQSNSKAQEKKKKENHSVLCIHTQEELNNLVQTLLNSKKALEATAVHLLKTDEQGGIAFCYGTEQKEHNLCYVPFGGLLSESLVWLSLAPFFEGNGAKLLFHAKQAIHVLQEHNIVLQNVIFDAVLVGYLLHSTKSYDSISDIAFDFLGEAQEHEMAFFSKRQLVKAQLTLDDFSNETTSEKAHIKDEEATDIAKFACMQAETLFKAFPLMMEQLENKQMSELYKNMELPLVYVLADMESQGIRVDREALVSFGERLQIELNRLTLNIHRMAGEEFNINSPKQLGEVLFGKLQLPMGKKTKTGWSTSVDVLEKLQNDHEIVGEIMAYRTHAKLKSTYVDGLLQVMGKDNVIHSTFNQTVTATGRISSTEPNLQNIPIKTTLGKELRKIFVPKHEDFVFVDADYSQIELRVLAVMAQDEVFINAFAKGEDIHQLTAASVFHVPFDQVTQTQRSYAKAVNFGIVYGIGAFSLSQDIGVSVKQAQTYIDDYFEKYPQMKHYLDKCIEEAKTLGYAKTMFGRRRDIPELSSAQFTVRSFGERVAMNMPVQGTAADIIKLAMVNVYKRLNREKLRSKLILQVHDELLIEAHKSEVEQVKLILQEEMRDAFCLSVPLDISIAVGENWLDAK